MTTGATEADVFAAIRTTSDRDNVQQIACAAT